MNEPIPARLPDPDDVGVVDDSLFEYLASRLRPLPSGPRVLVLSTSDSPSHGWLRRLFTEGR